MFTRIIFFFFNDTATTEIYTLSLHDALPIYPRGPDLAAAAGDDLVADAHLAAGRDRHGRRGQVLDAAEQPRLVAGGVEEDRKSTRLNSSHANISYAVFCLKKKNSISCPSSAP